MDAKPISKIKTQRVLSSLETSCSINLEWGSSSGWYRISINVHRRHEPVATDTVFADVPAIYSGGCKMAQGFVGRCSMVADVYLMGSEKEFVQTLTDHPETEEEPG